MASTTTHPALEAPRSPQATSKLRRRGASRSGRTNFELYSWMFMRFSGVLLVFLVFGHLIIMLVLPGGVERIDFSFVAGRWASPFWQIWDLLMLWFATLHGMNGLRTVINDYAERNATRITLKTLLYTASIWMVFLGSLVIFTFDPNIRH